MLHTNAIMLYFRIGDEGETTVYSDKSVTTALMTPIDQRQITRQNTIKTTSN